MKKFAFLTSEFYPMADANGVCVKNAADELIKRGCKVTVICEGKGKNERAGKIDVIHIKDTLYKRLNAYTERKNNIFTRFMRKAFLCIRRVVLGLISPFTFPNVSPMRSFSEYRVLEKLYKQEPFDCVIGTFRPYENIEAVNKFKIKHPEVKSEIIYLDILDAKNPFGMLFDKYFRAMVEKSEKRTFDINDLILIPKSAEEKYSGAEYKFAGAKIRFFDFPLFTAKTKKTGERKTGDTLNIVYAGSADGFNRNAEYFLEIAQKLRERGESIMVSFYGSFSDRKIMQKYKDTDFVRFCGKILPNEVEKVLLDADFLLNLSNRVTYTMIPSKIFQMFSTCQPIINMVANEKDASLGYFAKYPAAVNIPEYEKNLETDVQKISEFMENMNDFDVDFEKVRNTFSDNTPETFCDILTKGAYNKQHEL